MKRIQSMIVCAVVFALAGLTVLRAVEEGRKDGKATIRTVHGTVDFLDNNNNWQPVKPNMKFGPGVTIRTGANGSADISVNGLASVVRMTNSTTIQIPTMSYIGTTREGDTTTMLNLESGAILGNVKKISANSRYEIMTPHGVAGIRGTDFRVEAIPTPDGTFRVKFDSITGIITVSAVVDGHTIVHTLTTGTSWEIGQDPTQMTAEILANYQNEIMAFVQEVENIISNGGNFNHNNNWHNGPNPTTPFTGGQPGGEPAS